MENEAIAESFSLLSKLMDIHGENAFKTRSYANAAFQIENLSQPLTQMSEEAILGIRGVGEAIGQKILQLLSTGHLPLLEKYLNETPEGVRDMLHIKGLGPKKIAIVWKELGIEDLGELLYACDENRLMLLKGFGAKTQENIRGSIEFFMASRGQFLFEELEAYAGGLITHLKHAMGDQVLLSLSGDMRRQCNILEKVTLVIGSPWEIVAAHLPDSFKIVSREDAILRIVGPEMVNTEILCTAPEAFYLTLFLSTGSDAFVQACTKRSPDIKNKSYPSESALFTDAGLPFIEAPLREEHRIPHTAHTADIPVLIQTADIRGIIHAHSTWSDGKNTLEEMAMAARDQGFEYFVISDHSQAAAYAKGLKPDRILAQHAEIDALNAKLAPFRIFKSIESDILSNGSLDYAAEVLQSFDLVIASVHSNLKMDESKAMQRLLTAIQNPYTTILGHPTGRLLLSRPGYPVNHRQIIDACKAHQVVIEINAHPRRLDLDWRWISYAIGQGVMLSIDPDAHSIEGMRMIRYGVLSAQKGGLERAGNLSSLSLKEFEDFLKKYKQKTGT